jgi:tetratricopeptide (TPR) repeat protein
VGETDTVSRRLAALLVVLAAGSARASTERLAIVVGNDYAVGERAPLRYAEEDAAKVAAVLRELGDVAPDDLFLLRGLGLSHLETAIERVRHRAAARHKVRERTLLIFYFSGHSDGVSLELGADRLRFEELRRLLASSGADVRVAIVDSCRSGALLAVKGTRPGPTFDIHLSDDGAAEGTALLTSSAANEEALESKELHGSFFTHHFVSGLRGAADSSGDGQVTLAEAYQYAYSHTVAATADTIVGAQHPAYDYRLAGIGEIVLTELRRSSASLTLPPGFDRALVTRQDDVVAEVPAGAARRLGLAAGQYRVTLWRRQGSVSASLSANVELAGGESRQLAWAALTPAEPAAFALAKGAAAPQGEAELERALKYYESFQDEKTLAALRELLARHPSAAVAAKAHLYLGLVLFNGSRSEEAREEFKQAMLADAAVELPFNTSPKARLAFGEARRELAREVEASPEVAPSDALAAAPAAATSASTLEVSSEAPPRRSHWLTWTLGGLGVAAGAVAVYGGIEVLNYNSLANRSKTPGLDASQFDSTNGDFWRVGWIVAAAVGAAGLTAAVLVW